MGREGGEWVERGGEWVGREGGEWVEWVGREESG